jgi:hypothetical protein
MTARGNAPGTRTPHEFSALKGQNKTPFRPPRYTAPRCNARAGAPAPRPQRPQTPLMSEHHPATLRQRERRGYEVLKPNHRAIKAYQAALDGFAGQQIHHELAVRSAFQTLLADAARAWKWMLVPELATRTRGRRVVPDGTLRDEFSIPRGFWEAKDTHDASHAEFLGPERPQQDSPGQRPGKTAPLH